ncbi:MAG: RNA polymerase sigma factor [Bacteroidia bacterium]|nr:RNA polymerase sigma factor [Bacteroidia bacterium]
MQFTLTHYASEKLPKRDFTQEDFLKDEALLVRECVANNRLACKTLYEKYHPKLLAVSMRYIHNLDDAEDLMQESFITIFEKLGAFKSNSRLSTWLTRIVINNSLQFLRKKHPTLLSYEDDWREPVEEDIAEEEIEQFSANEVLAAIGHLPTELRVVLCLFSIDGYSHKEVSKSLGITENNSRSRLSRARKQLRIILKRKEAKHVS